jgi:Flp pilus assembly protein TadB
MSRRPQSISLSFLVLAALIVLALVALVALVTLTVLDVLDVLHVLVCVWPLLFLLNTHDQHTGSI